MKFFLKPYAAMILAGSLAFSITSCKDEDEDPITPTPDKEHQIAEFKMTFGNNLGTYTESYSYLSNGKLKTFENEMATGSLNESSIYEFKYKSSGEIEKVLVDNTKEIPVATQNGKVVRTDEEDSEYGGKLTTIFEYNSSNQLIKSIEWLEKGTENEMQISEYTFTYYPDGNLKESRYYELDGEGEKTLIEGTIYEQYDDKPNGRTWEFQLPNIVLQKNNPTKIRTIYDEDGEDQEMMTVTYEYNTKGYPIKLSAVTPTMTMNATFTYTGN